MSQGAEATGAGSGTGWHGAIVALCASKAPGGAAAQPMACPSLVCLLGKGLLPKAPLGAAVPEQRGEDADVVGRQPSLAAPAASAK